MRVQACRRIVVNGRTLMPGEILEVDEDSVAAVLRLGGLVLLDDDTPAPQFYSDRMKRPRSRTRLSWRERHALHP